MSVGGQCAAQRGLPLWKNPRTAKYSAGKRSFELEDHMHQIDGRKAGASMWTDDDVSSTCGAQRLKSIVIGQNARSAPLVAHTAATNLDRKTPSFRTYLNYVYGIPHCKNNWNWLKVLPLERSPEVMDCTMWRPRDTAYSHDSQKSPYRF